MAPRRQVNRARNDVARTPRNRAPKYVSLFGSPKTPAPTPVKRQSTPIDQSDSYPPSGWSSLDRHLQLVRSTFKAEISPAPAPAPAPAKQRLETSNIASPRRVARAFESEVFHCLSEVQPVSTARPTQHQSRLPPRTVARKAPRKAIFPTTAISGPSRVEKTQPKSSETKKLSRKCNGQSTPTFPALKSVEEHEEASAASDSKVHNRKTVEVSTPTHAVVTVSQPQRPKRSQPKFTYNLTSELEGIKRALGEDDWIEYVALVEERESGEISGSEFEKQERRIFQTPSIPGLQRVIREMVAQRMSDMR